MLLKTIVNGIKVQIDLPGVSLKAYRAIEALLDDKLSNPNIKNREAIAAGFLNALKQCPHANASDLWHHGVYRLYCAILPRYRPQDPKQSWVRAGGDMSPAGTSALWQVPAKLSAKVDPWTRLPTF